MAKVRIPKTIPDLPSEVFHAGWQREGKVFPSYKYPLSDNEAGETYDFYTDVTIEGEFKTYFLGRMTIEALKRNYKRIMDRHLSRISEGVNESDPELITPDVALQYLWRAEKPIELEVEE